jgi:hypothetical protein
MLIRLIIFSETKNGIHYDFDILQSYTHKNEHSDLPNLMNIRVDTAHGCTAAEDLRPVDVEGGNSLTSHVCFNKCVRSSTTAEYCMIWVVCFFQKDL